MFETASTRKTEQLNVYGCSGAYRHSFFRSFTSFSDLEHNAKAVIFGPIINAYLSLTALQTALISSTLGIANLAVGTIALNGNTLETGFNNIIDGVGELFNAGYFAISIITDCIGAILRLATHTLATIALGVYKTGQAITSGCSSQDADEDLIINPNVDYF